MTKKKILIPTDFSKASSDSLRYGCELAVKIGADVEVLHVVYPEVETSDLPMIAAHATQERVRTARELVRNVMENHSSLFKGSDCTYNTHIEVGMPVSVITQVARRDLVYTILIGTAQKHFGIEKLFGSTTTGVIEKSSGNVLVVPEGSEFSDIKTVAYATDLLASDPYQIWKAIHWLEPFRPVLHVVHFSPDPKMEDKKKFDQLKSYFESQNSSMQTFAHYVSGEDLRRSLDKFVRKNDIELLIMYKPQRNFLQKMFHQSQTKSMALHTHKPLLVVKE